MIFSLLIALQTTAAPLQLRAAWIQPVAPTPPPRIVPAPSPPPIPTVRADTVAPYPTAYSTVRPLTPVSVPGMPSEAFASYMLEVEVRAGAEILWSGSLRAGPSRAASYTREISQAPEGDCSRPSYGRDSESSSLRLTLSPQLRDGGLRIGVGARWQRPSGGGCEQPGSRTVELSEIVDLPSSNWHTINGDGGLTVRLRRR
jgi:hypothetical protein